VLRLILRDHIVVHTAVARASLTPEPSSSPLTETEPEIPGGITRGETNRQIATRLHLSKRTIRRRIRRIYSKLGVTDRVEAAVYAGRYGLSDTQLPRRSPLVSLRERSDRTERDPLQAPETATGSCVVDPKRTTADNRRTRRDGTRDRERPSG